jgi:hypothetical protein
MEKIKKRFGIGSLSVLLVFFGLLWDGFRIGDSVLNSVGLPTWSGDIAGKIIPFTWLYSLLFFAPAFLVGNTYKSDFGAKAGKILALIFGTFSILFPLYLLIF